MFFFFFFQAEDGIRDVAVTGVQTCALPILVRTSTFCKLASTQHPSTEINHLIIQERGTKYRSEEHTSELQSRLHLVCRLLLEKKKKKKNKTIDQNNNKNMKNIIKKKAQMNN